MAHPMCAVVGTLGWISITSMFTTVYTGMSVAGLQYVVTWSLLMTPIGIAAPYIAKAIPLQRVPYNSHKRYWLLVCTSVLCCAAIACYVGPLYLRMVAITAVWAGLSGIVALYATVVPGGSEEVMFTLTMMPAPIAALMFGTGFIWVAIISFVVSVLLYLRPAWVAINTKTDRLSAISNSIPMMPMSPDVNDIPLTVHSNRNLKEEGVILWIFTIICLILSTLALPGTWFLLFITAVGVVTWVLSLKTDDGKVEIMTTGLFLFGVLGNVGTISAICAAVNDGVDNISNPMALFVWLSGLTVIGTINLVRSYSDRLTVRSIGLCAMGVAILGGILIAFFVDPKFDIGGLLFIVMVMSTFYPAAIILELMMVYCVVWRVKLVRSRLQSETMLFVYILGVVCGSWLGGLLSVAFDVRGPVSAWAGADFSTLPYLVLFASSVLPLAAMGVLYITIPNIPVNNILTRPVVLPELGEDDGDTQQ
jgi:hypothetical protein